MSVKETVKKRQVLHIFNQEIRPYVSPPGAASTDIPALRQAWNDYVDMLVKDGLLTENQVKTWNHPFP